jgi:arsenate reductase
LKAEKLKILFLCTTNTHRSQMAEGWARYLKADCIEAYSAGIEPHGLNPFAVKVMAEAGVDISRQSSKHVYDLKVLYDYIVVVCTHAHKSCPLFPGSASVTYVSFDDPPKMAPAFDSEEEKLECYRVVRDQIKAFIQTLPEAF